MTRLDPAYEWHYRVLGSNTNGGVTGSEVVATEAGLEAAHERVMAIPGTKVATTMGPFRTRVKP